MHDAGEQFLLTCTVLVFIGTLLFQVVRIFQFEIEDAFDKVWATFRKFLR